MTRAVEIEGACVGETGAVGGPYFEPKESRAVARGHGPFCVSCTGPVAALVPARGDGQWTGHSSTIEKEEHQP